MDFGGFDFSDAFTRGSAAARRAPVRPPGESANFQDIFSQWFGRAQSEPPQPRREKGADLEYGLNIDFWQAISGTQVRLNITRQEVCATCHGTGARRRRQHGLPGVQRQRQRDPDGRRDALQPHLPALRRHRAACAIACPTCHGDGRISHTETVEVRIPPGAQQGSRLRVPAKATPAPWARLRAISTSPLRVEPHPFFRREATTSRSRCRSRIDEAGLGAKIEVPTIDGRALLKIPQGTKNGQKFRLREKGVLNSRTNKRGDQIVEVAIEAPDGAGRAHQGTAARVRASCIPKIRARRSGRKV